ncbi:hypothetical protein AX016_3311 [Cellulophaga sp. RHA19]|uniref:hypothetical protein n=1 Tax=Cellulophaga sp. RHA19 TaxID=1798237 RepID=UPI000C2CB431|nr:hypothetical protein [Cellulophaga sp. RHA19]PKB45074.1 hypothetical protein AX016_3311 [Cellulophaga sp. RHA19]
MKKILLTALTIFLVSCADKKAKTEDTKTTEVTSNKTEETNAKQEPSKPLNKEISLGSYTGKINNNLEVAFDLDNKEGHINGFYYYKKIGVDIKVVGTVVADSLLAYELNYKNDTLAILKGKIEDSGIKGVWVNAENKKEYPLVLTQAAKKVTPLPVDILGEYYNEVCNLTLTFTKSKGEYYYSYKSKERNLKGKLNFYRDEGLYINLTEIEYAEDYFDVALPEEDTEKEKEYAALKKIGKRTLGVEGQYSPGELTIQNYGNAMNYYVKLNDCGEKYIHFKKK